jgi:hypothetical protein
MTSKSALGETWIQACFRKLKLVASRVASFLSPLVVAVIGSALTRLSVKRV